MNGATALVQAGTEFRPRLSLVSPSDWARPTPCDDWCVRDLVDHVVGGNFRYVMILGGHDSDAVVATRTEDWLEAGAMSAFDLGLRAVTEAFARPGVLAARVEHPKVGTVTGAQLRVLRVNELAVHAWDLAQAIGAAEQLAGPLSQWLYEQLQPLRSTLGLHREPRRLSPANVTSQDRLLALLGRQPT